MKKKFYKKFFNSTITSAVVATSVLGGTALGAETSTPSNSTNSLNFSDVKVTDYFYEAVKILTERGIIKGFPDGTFKPYQKVTRGQVAVILANLLKLDTSNVEDPGFTDVPKTHPYYGAIAALYKAGYIKGFEDGTFKPGETINRYHAALILTKVFKLTAKNPYELPFTDVYPAYKEAVSAFYENKVTSGSTPTTFSGSANLTRGQFVTFLLKAEEATQASNEENEVKENENPGGSSGGGGSNSGGKDRDRDDDDDDDNDNGGGNPGGGDTETPPADTTAPVTSVISNIVLIGQNLSVQSSEKGKVFLTTTSDTAPVSVEDLEKIDVLSTTVDTANVYKEINTEGLSEGTYNLYAVDEAGNISKLTTIYLFEDPYSYIKKKLEELEMMVYGTTNLEEISLTSISNAAGEQDVDEFTSEVLKQAYVILMAIINYSNMNGIGIPTKPFPEVTNNINEHSTFTANLSEGSFPVILSDLELSEESPEKFKPLLEEEQTSALAEELLLVLLNIDFDNILDHYNLPALIGAEGLLPEAVYEGLALNGMETLTEIDEVEAPAYTADEYTKKLESTLKILSNLVKFTNEDNTELKEFDSDIVEVINYVIPYLYLGLVKLEFLPYEGIELTPYENKEFSTFSEDENLIVYDLLYLFSSDISLHNIEYNYGIEFGNDEKKEIIRILRDYVYNEYFANLLVDRAITKDSDDNIKLISSLDEIINLDDFNIPSEMEEEYIIKNILVFNLALSQLYNIDQHSSVVDKFNAAIEQFNMKYPNLKYTNVVIDEIDLGINAFKIIPQFFDATFENRKINLLNFEVLVNDELKEPTFDYKLYTVPTVEENDEIYLIENEDGTIQLELIDSDNNGSLNGLHELEIYDKENDFYYNVSFVVTNKNTSDGSPEIIHIFEEPYQYLYLDSEAFSGSEFILDLENSSPYTKWEIDGFGAGLLGYEYLVVLYDSTTDKVLWAVNEIPRFTNEIEQGSDDEAGNVLVEFDVSNLTNEETHNIIMEVFLLNKTVDLDNVQDYKTIISKIQDSVTAYGYMNGTYTSGDTAELVVPLVEELVEQPKGIEPSSGTNSRDELEEYPEEETTKPNDEMEDGKLDKVEPTEEDVDSTSQGTLELDLKEIEETDKDINTNQTIINPLPEGISFRDKDKLVYGVDFILENGVVRLL